MSVQNECINHRLAPLAPRGTLLSLSLLFLTCSCSNWSTATPLLEGSAMADVEKACSYARAARTRMQGEEEEKERKRVS